MDRLRRCGSCSVISGGGVTVGITALADGSSSAGYGGVATCGSVWVCPQCGAKVAARRAGEIADVMRTVDEMGGSSLLATFTVRHQHHDRLGWSREQRRRSKVLENRARDRRYRAELGDEIDEAEVTADQDARAQLDAARGTWDAVGDGWQAIISGAQWAKDQKLHGGLLGWVRVVETTVGRAGWHTHVHVLMCFAEDVDGTTVTPVVARMFRRWKGALERAGYDASGDMAADGKVPGYDVRRADPHDNKITNYLTKLAYEMTGSHTKEGRRPGGRTPMQLLADAVETYNADDLARWWEWETASEGRKQLTWSTAKGRDLRKLAGLGEESTDEEIAAEEMGADERVFLAAETWGWLRSEARETELLDVAETAGPTGLTAWLDEHGQTYVQGIGAGWVDQPGPLPPTVIPAWDGGEGVQLGVTPRDEGAGLGYSRSTPAILRRHTTDGRRLRRPSDRPPRHTDEAWAAVRADPWDPDTYSADHDDRRE